MNAQAVSLTLLLMQISPHSTQRYAIICRTYVQKRQANLYSTDVFIVLVNW